MKKSYALALLLSVCAVTSFAQEPSNSAGARRVAERDAAYAKSHPVVVHKVASLPRRINQHSHRHLRHRVVTKR